MSKYGSTYRMNKMVFLISIKGSCGSQKIHMFRDRIARTTTAKNFIGTIRNFLSFNAMKC